MTKTEDMTTDEMIEVLKAIIRDGKNGAARIAAIKQLREMTDGDQDEGAFSDLDELAPRRNYRAKAA